MLDDKVMNRVFTRLALAYGARWKRMWEGLEEAAVRTAWAHELRDFAEHLDRIAWALDHLPASVPSAPAFRDLCREAPYVEKTPVLPEQKWQPTPPEVIEKHLEKLDWYRRKKKGERKHEQMD